MMGERCFADDDVATHLGYAALALAIVVFLNPSKSFFCHVSPMSVFPMQTTQGCDEIASMYAPVTAADIAA